MEKLTRHEQKEQTRNRLIEKAERLFARSGIAVTTTADVAKALQVSHGTVFLHFPTREDLVLAVVDNFGDRLSEELGKRLSTDLSLRELLKAHLSVLAEHEDFYLRLICESHSLPPGIRGLVFAMNSALSYRFHRAGKELMKNGKVKRLEQAPFFNAWMALVHYHILNRDLFSDKAPVLEHMGDEIINQFFKLIKKEEL